MLLDKVLLATLQFSINGIHILDVLVLVISQTCIIEPECTMLHGELVINLSAKRNLNFLDCLKHQYSQLGIEIIEGQSVFKPAFWLERMKNFICLHRTQILNKSKVTNFAKKFSSICLVAK